MKVKKSMCIAVAAATALTLGVGCSSKSGEQSAEGDAQVIKFAFAPDPVWDLLKDSGTTAKWEQENNVRIETSSTWDEFTYFAGGHGDIVSMATQETPVLEAETGIKTVTFGKYNYQRVPMFKRKGDPYKTLADIPKGSKICVSGPTSNTAFWTMFAKEMHDLDYRVGGGDFELVVNDHFVNPTNLLRGDCEAAAIIPEAAIPQLRKGELEIMYDGKLPFQLYKEFAPDSDGKLHVMRQQLHRHREVVRRATRSSPPSSSTCGRRASTCGRNRRPRPSASTRSTSRSSPRTDVKYMIDFVSGRQRLVRRQDRPRAGVDRRRNGDLGLCRSNSTRTTRTTSRPDAPTPRFEAITPQ